MRHTVNNMYYCSKVWGSVRFVREFNAFIRNGLIKFMTGDSKYIYNIMKDFYFEMFAVHFNFLFLKGYFFKGILVCTKI